MNMNELVVSQAVLAVSKSNIVKNSDAIHHKDVCTSERHRIMCYFLGDLQISVTFSWCQSIACICCRHEHDQCRHVNSCYKNHEQYNSTNDFRRHHSDKDVNCYWEDDDRYNYTNNWHDYNERYVNCEPMFDNTFLRY